VEDFSKKRRKELGGLVEKRDYNVPNPNRLGSEPRLLVERGQKKL